MLDAFMSSAAGHASECKYALNIINRRLSSAFDKRELGERHRYFSSRKNMPPYRS